MRVPTYARGLFLALVAWVLGVGLALAHSGLQRAEPPVESTLKRPPKELKLYFSERLEPAYSVEYGSSGVAIDKLRPSWVFRRIKLVKFHIWKNANGRILSA